MNESHYFIISPYHMKNIFILFSVCSTAWDVSVTLGIGDPCHYKYRSCKFVK